MRREGKFNDQKYSCISSLQTYYLNLERSSGSGRKNDRSDLVQEKCTFCEGTNHPTEKCFKILLKYKGKSRAASDLERQKIELPPRKFVRCGHVDHLICKCPKPGKDNKNEEGTSVLMKMVIVHRKNNPRIVMMITIKIHMHL